MLLPEWSERRSPVIGMLHAMALPGAPTYGGDLARVRKALLDDAEALVTGGVDGLMLENFGDSPFYPDRVPAMTVAALTALATEVRRCFAVPLGINVLRNDGRSALAVAVACGASFIRVNILCGARVADQGLLQGIAHELLRDRASLQARGIQIWADVDVKHSAALAARSLRDEVRDLIERGMADAVIVSGAATGSPIDLETLRTVRDAARGTPVLIGSGVMAESLGPLVPFAEGLIVGSSLKREGLAKNSVDIDRVRSLVAAVHRQSD